MGALCGKESKGDNFAGQGRPLGSAPPQGPTSAPLPANKRVGGPPRTLGAGAGDGPSSSDPASDARRRAAEAAEVRAIPRGRKEEAVGVPS